jgi:mono/diheme cytochrome c family protein
MFEPRSLAVAAAIGLSGCGPSPISDHGINPRDSTQVARGRVIYDQHCASCHGAKLEGQPNWRQRGPDGRLPAPPHDDSGHTWHHPNSVLFAITKNGLRPPHAPEGYVSDMPAYAGVLNDDEIRAVLAFIESHWSDDVWKARREMTRRP